jgi:hypothetical protein
MLFLTIEASKLIAQTSLAYSPWNIQTRTKDITLDAIDI